MSTCKDLREYYGLTQDAMARILRVTCNTVCRYEVGAAKPVGDSAKVMKVLEAFKVTDPQASVSSLSVVRGSAIGEVTLALAVTAVIAVLRTEEAIEGLNISFEEVLKLRQVQAFATLALS